MQAPLTPARPGLVRRLALWGAGAHGENLAWHAGAVARRSRGRVRTTTRPHPGTAPADPPAGALGCRRPRREPGLGPPRRRAAGPPGARPARGAARDAQHPHDRRPAAPSPAAALLPAARQSAGPRASSAGTYGGLVFTTRPELAGTFGMVASTHWLATAAGMATLEAGRQRVRRRRRHRLRAPGRRTPPQRPRR